MPWLNEQHWDWETIVGGACKASSNGKGARLAKELLSGHYRPEQSVRLREIAAKYKMDTDSV